MRMNALEIQPITPRVTMAMTMTGYCTMRNEFQIR